MNALRKFAVHVWPGRAPYGQTIAMQGLFPASGKLCLFVVTDIPILVLFAKYPVPGFAKTRLVPALGPDGAAAVHRHLTQRTVATLLASGAPVEVRFTGASAEAMRGWLGNEVALAEQVAGGLTERLIDASRDTPHIFFGADTPDLDVDTVRAAIAALRDHDVVIGPAEDGGYYLIGMQTAQAGLLTDMHWSTEHVFPETLGRCAAFGLSTAILPVLADCDRPEDLTRWPELRALA